jgi:excisionase family DNA binding protein
MDPLYTTHDISRLLQVDPSTVSKWIDRGILLAFRTPGGHRRVRKKAAS